MSGAAEGDIGSSINALHASLLTVSTMAIILRFSGRWVCGAGVWWDDWCTVLAWLFSLGCSISNLLLVRDGLGSIAHITPAAIVEYRKSFYAQENTYHTTITVIKWAVLLMYARVFARGSSDKGFRRSLWITAALIAVWYLGVEIALIFQCTPLRKIWHQEVPGTCISSNALFYSQSVPNIVLDVVILLLPQQQIYKLHMDPRQKLRLALVFLAGSLTAICSIARTIIIVVQNKYVSAWSFFEVSVWSALEPTVGLVSVCLPCVWPMARVLLGKTRAAQPRGFKQTSTTPSSDAESVGMNRVQNTRAGAPRYKVPIYSQRTDSIDDLILTTNDSVPMGDTNFQTKMERKTHEVLEPV